MRRGIGQRLGYLWKHKGETLFGLGVGILATLVALLIVPSQETAVAAVVAIVIFLGLLIWYFERAGDKLEIERLVQIEQQVQETSLGSNQPDLGVHAFDEMRSLILEVTNKGAAAAIEVQIELLGEGPNRLQLRNLPPLPTYPACWQRSGRCLAHLSKDKSDRIVLARLNVDYASFRATWVFPYYHVGENGCSEFESTGWIITEKESNFSIFDLGVTITATPRLKDDPWVRTYRLNYRDRESRFREVELL
jgi:hypothetical protein